MKTLIKVQVLSLLAGLSLTNALPFAAEDARSPGVAAIAQAIAGAHRSPENRARDIYRHPQQTLEFFGVQDSMTVVEIWPGAEGWYTEILAPLLRNKGTLYAAHFSAESEIPFFTSSLARFKQKMAANPAIYDKIILTTLQPPARIEIAPKGAADRVLTFRNVHNWMKSGDGDAVFRAMFDALKPGGILGVVEHRGIAGQAQDPKALSGYVTEDTVKDLARKAGFEWIDSSEINANPKDTRIHPEGVWTLPPTLRLGDLDAEKYREIGESDRMTLKFRKPGIEKQK
ncbi:MAG: methyltransferase [Methylococcaceae bacterium]|nr:methyltransferase [Methylococcaceae bacterium]